MKKINLYIILLIITSPTIYGQSNWELSTSGVGIIKLGNSSKETKEKIEKFYQTKNTIINKHLLGFQVYEKDKRILSISSFFKTDIINSILITSDQFETTDKFKIGQSIKEINNIDKDFFLEYDEQSGGEYFFRKENVKIGNQDFEKIIKFYFKGTNSDYIGTYQFNKEIGRKDKSYMNNGNAVIGHISIELIEQ